MKHRLSNVRTNPRSGRVLADCSECGKGVGVLTKANGKQVCEKSARMTAGMNRKRKTPEAIKRIEKQRKLGRTEAIKLIDEEWKRVIREKHSSRCAITGAYCPPGVRPGMGNAAHLIPRSQAPFHLKYDVRNGIYLEWELHMGFDGLLLGKRRPARQALVWGWLAKNRPEDFEYLTGTNWRADITTVPITEVRETLEALRSIRYEEVDAA